jgi:hypothetical protein
MKTDSLIRALAADVTAEAPLGRSVRLAVALGGAVTLALFFVALGVRPNALASLGTSPRFDFKFVVTLLLAATAARLLMQLSRPGASEQRWLLVLAPTLLFCAVAAELAAVPAAGWATALFGTTWRACLYNIPALSLPILVALLVALRRGAPGSPAATGAVAGLLAGGLGGAIYASHCPGDSPLFLGAWYTLTIAALAFVGGIAGRWLLRW